MIEIRPKTASTLLLGALACACSPVSSEVKSEDPSQRDLLETVEAQATPDPSENCLLMVWSDQDDPDIAFDRANDAVKGGAISCAM